MLLSPTVGTGCQRIDYDMAVFLPLAQRRIRVCTSTTGGWYIDFLCYVNTGTYLSTRRERSPILKYSCVFVILHAFWIRLQNFKWIRRAHQVCSHPKEKRMVPNHPILFAFCMLRPFAACLWEKGKWGYLLEIRNKTICLQLRPLTCLWKRCRGGR